MKKIIILSFALVLITTGCSLKKTGSAPKNLTADEAKIKAEKFINENLVQPGKNVTIKEMVEENGLFKITVVLATGQEIISYMTKDGGKFFPQVMDIAETEKQTLEKKNQTNNVEETKTEAQNAPKKDKPSVEVFVMSHCPYGTQIEKGVIPVAETLGNKIDFSIKFVDYAMHGEKEIDEQTRQYCIQKEQKASYFNYLKCFLKDGNSDSCLKSAKIDENKMNACVAATDKQYGIKEKFADKSKWSNGSFPPFDVYKQENVNYEVQGSPTLVINSTQINSGRDSASLLSAICSSFTTQPEECKKQLSSASPAPGFGEGVDTSGGADAGCATN